MKMERVMHILKNRWYFIAALAVVLGVAVWRALPMLPFHGVQANGHRTATATTPIQHIVIIMLENHGFDNMFGRFPTMAYVSGSYSTGALFQVQTTLPNGNHKFFVVFADSQTSWTDPFAPTVYAGPNVGANAKPVAPGTVIMPSHTQNPDLPQDTDDN